MPTPEETPSRPAVESLDKKSTEQWLKLAAATAAASAGPRPCQANEQLSAAAGSEPQSPVAPAYRLWIADNMAREARYREAVRAFDAAIDCAQSARRLVPQIDATCCCLLHKAQAATICGDSKVAISTYRELAEASSDAAEPLFLAGSVAESDGDDAQAADLYRSVAGKRPSARTADPAELARRALQRLEDPRATYLPSAEALGALLADALERCDVERLDSLASRTHFAVGPVGGHTAFEEPEILERFLQELQESTVGVQRQLVGSGGKLYLLTSSWDGEWFRGDVVCLLTRAPKGWQWTGVAVSQPHEPWVERWRPAVKQTNQPLPFELRAPWPARVSFKAGGLTEFAVRQAAIVAAGAIFGAVLAAQFARNPCGFGPRGFYYNQGSTHDEEDAFAIDFTRYKQNIPYDPETGGTPVLAARGGLVVRVSAGTSSGDSSASNTVEIVHADPDNPTATDRFRTRYLHLAGPFLIPVSAMMPVITGQRLGLMDDTGNSVLNHLHFSIHDKTLPHPNASYGRSVRPSPLSGVSLGDGGSGTCVRSTNLERTPGLNFSPTSLSFGSVPEGDIRTRTVMMENTTGASVDASFPASPAGSFFFWRAFSDTLADGESKAIVIEFRPRAEGLVRATLTITSTAAGSPHRIRLSGTGLGGVEPL